MSTHNICFHGEIRKIFLLRNVCLSVTIGCFLTCFVFFSGELYDIGWGQKLFLSCKGKGEPTG